MNQTNSTLIPPTVSTKRLLAYGEHAPARLQPVGEHVLPPLACGTQQATPSYKERLTEYTRATVFDFLNKCPRDQNRYVMQADLLLQYMAQYGQLSPVAFGKFLSEYVEQVPAFAVKKKRMQNRCIVSGLSHPNCESFQHLSPPISQHGPALAQRRAAKQIENER